jgi:CheY-like chemotaxis protein
MTRRTSILLVEDEESDVEIFRRALKRAGLAAELVVARDGQEAVEYLDLENCDQPKPGLLLLDLKMPRMDGFEVLTWLNTKPCFKNLPVLVLTSSSHDSDIRKAREMGAREFFVKPGGIHELVKILQDIYARYLAPRFAPLHKKS